jgi:hypothetical protein
MASYDDSDGMAAALGAVIEQSPHSDSDLQYNEYIGKYPSSSSSFFSIITTSSIFSSLVYDEAQVDIRYLVLVKFDFD